MSNSLQKYYRQPKIFLSLPSMGNYYPPGSIQGDPTKLPVFGMTAMDEIMFKTPDALFSGDATVAVIKSCIPAIQNPWVIPSIDVDAILVALRIATYGQTLETMFKCTSCTEDNKFDLNLSKALDSFQDLKYDDEVITGPLVINIRPLTYREVTEFNMKTFELRKRIYNLAQLDSEDEKNKQLTEVYKDMAAVGAETYKKAIKSIEVDGETVTDRTEIEDWIKNSDKSFFDDIKKHIESRKDKWTLKTQKVQCVHCNADNSVTIGLDNSDFFVKS